MLGPAATTDMLLFRQLAAAMAESGERRAGCVRCMVRLRSAEAPNLRTAVKTIVQAALGASGGSGIGSGAGNDEDEDDVVASDVSWPLGENTGSHMLTGWPRAATTWHTT